MDRLVGEVNSCNVPSCSVHTGCVTEIAILVEAEQTGSINITRRKHKLQKIRIMNSLMNKEKLIEKLMLSRNLDHGFMLSGACVTEFSQYKSHIIQLDANLDSVIG